ncbi:hypothetical protein DBR43_02890 [Pedobacter sp. KBW06]|nr:hypothetical protein DBR43_02890 [Pedobacter sp. KBW06]
MKVMKLDKYLFCTLLSLALFSCKKEDGETSQNQKKNTLTDVVRDNFGLTYLATSLYRSGVDETLRQPGPYTLLAPSDAAYKALYYNPAAVFDEPVAKLAEENRYHVLKAEFSFSGKPLKMNQEMETLLGTKVYWSRVKRGQDTITTINGGRVLQTDTKADNGTMQVLDRVLVPNVHATLKEGLAANTSVTLFYQALKFSGLLETLTGSIGYTVFAPNNDAVKRYGYANLEAIEQASPEVLKAWLSYHIAKERKFAQDYFLLTPAGTTSYAAQMLNDQVLTVNLLGEYNVPNSFTGITLKGTGNSSAITPVKTDIVTGNGVIHVIGEVLK